MITRRHSLLILSSLCACAPSSPSNSTPVWLVVSPAASGYQLFVDGKAVELAEVEEALLDHAAAANPSMTRDEARQEVRFYVRSEPGTPTGWVEDLMPILRRFRRVGIVAEDRRR